MTALNELKQNFHADPTLDRSAAMVVAAGLTADDPTADLPAIRERVVHETYGDAFMDELRRA